MMREGLAQLIANSRDLEVCGEAGDANEALEKIESLKPDLVLTDITFPARTDWNSSKTSRPCTPACSCS